MVAFVDFQKRFCLSMVPRVVKKSPLFRWKKIPANHIGTKVNSSFPEVIAFCKYRDLRSCLCHLPSRVPQAEIMFLRDQQRIPRMMFLGDVDRRKTSRRGRTGRSYW